jgi:hypothetical protein
MTIRQALEARDLAQIGLEFAVKEAFPVGVRVVIKGLRGPEKKIVTGHDGEQLILGGPSSGTVGGIHRHFDKVTKE